MKNEKAIFILLAVIVILTIAFMVLGVSEVNSNNEMEDINIDKKIKCIHEDSLRFKTIKIKQKNGSGYVYIHDSVYDDVLLK